MQSRREFLKTLSLLLPTLYSFPSLAVSDTKQTIKGLYVPGWFGVTKSNIDSRLVLLEELGFNTLMIDVKNAYGELFYEPKNGLAKKISSQVQTKDGHKRFLEMNYLKDEANKKNVRLIARHVCFRDKNLYENISSSQLFKRKSEYWTNPRLEEVVDYNLSLLEEESKMGFDEIVLDYIRFPATTKFGPQEEKNQVIANVVKEVKKVVGPSDLSVQVFGYAAWDSWRAGVGQDLNLLAPHIDILYPMIYPSHFHKGSFGYEDPDAYPYEFIAMGYEQAKTKVKTVMPMIQAFSYPAHKISAQIQATKDAHMPGFVCWNPSGRYEQLLNSIVSNSVQ